MGGGVVGTCGMYRWRQLWNACTYAGMHGGIIDVLIVETSFTV
jgi:hypothetical protein